MVGRAIRKERERQGLTQQKLAERAQLSLRFVSAVENGQNLTVDVLQRFMRALGMTRIQIGVIEFQLSAEQQETLDAIGALSPESQAKLIEFVKSLEEGQEAGIRSLTG